MICLGLDTSNYTTSAALYNSDTGSYASERQLLPVAPGTLGLRQSDAVFHHTARLSGLIAALFEKTPCRPDLVAVSVKPSEQEGSYMPCFSVGANVAYAIAAAMGVPVYAFSHQLGHIGAVLCSAKRADLVFSPFYAFHLSGGTTDALFVRPDEERLLAATRLGGSSDLKAGQAIDRVGVMLGLPFPAGAALDALAAKSARTFRCRPFIKDLSCSFSGLQNQCERMLRQGDPKEDIAKYCLSYVCTALESLTDAMISADPDLPLVCSGGVSANSMLWERFSSKYRCVFASDGLASDNAVGLAFLGAVKALRQNGGVS